MPKAFSAQKIGYIDIKQSSKVRHRKLKSWKRRWAVLTKLSNLSSEEFVAILDLYDDESKWRSNTTDKVTFVLENVTSVRKVKSKTRQYAFEIVDSQPFLVMSGASEMESCGWILSLQQIFTPEQIEAKKDSYCVTVSPNEHSRKLNLCGKYSLTVTSSGISLATTEGGRIMSWGLNTLMKFNVEPRSLPGEMDTLVFECGPNSPTGHSVFSLMSNEAEDILDTIRQSICLALAMKQNAKSVQPPRPRTTSTTASERSFQKLLDTHSTPLSIPKDRSDSGISNSTMNCGSSVVTSGSSSSPSSSVLSAHFNVDMNSFDEKEEDISYCSIKKLQNGEEAKVRVCEKSKQSSHKRSSSHPGNSGYTEIQDVASEQKYTSRRNTISCHPSGFELSRTETKYAIIASPDDNFSDSFEETSGSSPYDNNQTSDMDPATPSLILSDNVYKLPPDDILHNQECSDGLCPGSLSRRRSSSTPDLKAYWKIRNSNNKFDNVYEELDELRASVKRLSMKQDFDNPPALPARPFSINATDHKDIGVQSDVTKKRFHVKWHRAPSYDSEDKNPHQSLNSENSCTLNVSQHGRKVSPVRLKAPASKISNNNKLCNINDINEIILQVQNVKQRRSSDVTPVKPSFMLPTALPVVSNVKPRNLESPSEALEPTNDFNSGSQENLINLQEKPDNLGYLTMSPKRIPNQTQNNHSNQLIRFFLDDEFDLFPAVNKEPSLQPPFRNVKSPKITSVFQNTTVYNNCGSAQPNRTPSWHESESVNFFGPSFGSDVDQANPVDIWGISMIHNVKPNCTMEGSASVFSSISLPLL